MAIKKKDNESKYKCFFCAEGNTPRNVIDQLEIIADQNGISKHDIIQLALIEEIRKIRIVWENGQQLQQLKMGTNDRSETK